MLAAAGMDSTNNIDLVLGAMRNRGNQTVDIGIVRVLGHKAEGEFLVHEEVALRVHPVEVLFLLEDLRPAFLGPDDVRVKDNIGREDI